MYIHVAYNRHEYNAFAYVYWFGFMTINLSLYIEESTFADWLEEGSFRTNAGVERRLEGVGSDAWR